MSETRNQSVSARSSDYNYYNKIRAELPNQIDIRNNSDSQLVVLAFAISNQSDNGYTDGFDIKIKSLTFVINDKYLIELDFISNNGLLLIGFISSENDNYSSVKYVELSNLNEINNSPSINLITKLYETETINFDNYIKGRYHINNQLCEIILGQLRILDDLASHKKDLDLARL